MREYLLLAVCMSAICGTLSTPYGLNPVDDLNVSLHPLLQWTGASFKFPCKSTKALYKNSGKYISKHIIGTRAQIARDELFVALPRFKSGTPATLVRTALKGGCHTVFEPFPCWTLQEEGNCQALQSVVDFTIDNNGILWALDTGIINAMENPIRKCPPKVVAFNIKTGKVLKTITLDGLTSRTSRLQYLVVDYSSDSRCFVYISDAASRALIVYDVQASRGYKLVFPPAVVAGSKRKDVLYIALIRKTCGSTVLYFTYLGGKRIFSINTEFLRKGYAQGRVVDVGIKPQKLVVIGTDGGSALFFRFEGQSEVYRWDANTCFKAANFRIVYRSPTCNLATHALPDLAHSRMVLLESNFPDYMKNTVGCGAVQQLSIMQGCW